MWEGKYLVKLMQDQGILVRFVQTHLGADFLCSSWSQNSLELGSMEVLISQKFLLLIR